MHDQPETCLEDMMMKLNGTGVTVTSFIATACPLYLVRLRDSLLKHVIVRDSLENICPMRYNFEIEKLMAPATFIRNIKTLLV